MDIARWPAEKVAGLVARVLDADGDTPEQRRAEVLDEFASSAQHVDSLVLRHITRSAVWGVLLAFALPGLLVVLMAASLAPGGRDGATFLTVFSVGAVVVFFIASMAGLHLLKMLVASYLPDRWWNPSSRAWRAVMLAQTPDIVLSLALATVVALSLL